MSYTIKSLFKVKVYDISLSIVLKRIRDVFCKCEQLMQSGAMLKESKLSWIDMFHSKTDDFVINDFL